MGGGPEGDGGVGGLTKVIWVSWGSGGEQGSTKALAKNSKTSFCDRNRLTVKETGCL